MKTLRFPALRFHSHSLNKTELAGYIILSLLLLTGLYSGLMHPEFYEFRYAQEDGPVENLTTLLLLLTSLVSFRRLKTISFRKQSPAFIITLLTGLLFLFAAGEEISWGQRIFNIQSGEYFVANNTQKEMNLHNLKVNDTNINKLIFGQIFTFLIILYATLLPFLYRKSMPIRKLIDRCGIPVMKNHHTLAILLATFIILPITNHKKWELFELTFALLMWLIVRFPFNKEAIHSEL